MPKLFIPTLGTELTLEKAWSFQLFEEYRNTTLIDHLMMLGVLGPTKPVKTAMKLVKAVYDATLPAGAVLQVDRIYIRKNLSEFDSISFLLKGVKSPAKIVPRVAVQFDGHSRIEIPYEEKKQPRPVRFWATLEDANTLQFK